MKTLYACVLAVGLLLVAPAVAAEPTPPDGYYCTFYEATCSVGTGACCACYDGFYDGVYAGYHNVEISVGDLLYFSDDSYDIPAGSCGGDPEIVPELYVDGWFPLAQNEVYTFTSPIPADNPLVDFQTCNQSSGSPGVFLCTDSAPPPTPMPTPTPVSGDEINLDWYSPNCETASVSCASTVGDPWIYANGVKLGRCSAMPATFTGRQSFTNTILLADTSPFTVSASVGCEDGGTSGMSGVFTPTMPTLPTPPPPPTDTMGAMGATGPNIPMPEFGGDLGDPNSPINRWLGYATSTINSVNTGNLLYIVGAVASAGMVLTWAINRVKNPRSW